MKKTKTQVIVIGAGPGGYAAAFYAADLGLEVTLVEREKLGGVCLNKGCIPSKALLHATEVLSELKHSEERGISLGKPKIDVNKLRTWKQSILDKLTGGIAQMAKQRKVTVIEGKAVFEDNQTLRVETSKGQQFIEFDYAIIATGSRPVIPEAFDLGNKRIMTSTEALEIEDIPKKLLVVGGGYIGTELGTVYAKLGSDVILAEANETILTGADADLVRPVKRLADQLFKEIRLGIRIQKMATKKDHINVTFQDGKGTKDELFDKVLIATGRRPNSEDLGLENTDIKKDDRGYVQVNDNLQTTVSNIYAIGDIAGGVLLAHKASKEAKIAVENITGEPTENKGYQIPAVVFTDPEVAWVGVTEAEAKEQNLNFEVAKFPWGALGKALTLDRPDGLTKLIVDKDTHRVLGMGMVGVQAGNMISEGALAIEMGATVEDIALTVHPHPTLAESIMEAAEVFLGHSTHTIPRKKK